MENGDYSKTQYSAVLLFCYYASSKFSDRRTETMDEYESESSVPGEETVIF
jgi:hypothetical protein